MLFESLEDNEKTKNTHNKTYMQGNRNFLLNGLVFINEYFVAFFSK